MKRSAWFASVLLVACSQGNGNDRTSDGVDTVVAAGSTSGAGTGGATHADASGSASGASTTGAASTTDGSAPKFDLGNADTETCAGRPAGIYCDENMAVECGDGGSVVDTSNCSPGVCLVDTGCVTCLEGQYNCQGPRVMACDTTADPVWEEVEVCNVAANPPEACDVGLGGCTALADIGGTEPTGVYYTFAEFTPAEGFSAISDVDSWGNRIYFMGRTGAGTIAVGVYEVELLDTDGDGILEPNQHPNNPDEPGEIEERAFTYIETIPVVAPAGLNPSVLELYVTDDRFYYSGNSIMEQMFAGGAATQIAAPPSWPSGGGWGASLSFLGYDDINGVWYSGTEAGRRVFQYDAESSSWGYAFQFPALAGDHMDGMEVVTDATTGTPYVYVSDMTSDFIGQYRLDPNLGWVQENLFSYEETTGALVEGFGYGALGHFWVGSLGAVFYELGGGDLTEFIDPEG